MKSKERDRGGNFILPFPTPTPLFMEVRVGERRKNFIKIQAAEVKFLRSVKGCNRLYKTEIEDIQSTKYLLNKWNNI